MDDYISLKEIYIYNSKLFKNKNFNNFIRNHKIQENDIVTKKHKILGIKKNWIKKNLPSFDLKLIEYKDIKLTHFYEVETTLKKYNFKTFNPIILNMDSSMVKYFIKEGKRTPYFTKKGLIKIEVLSNSIHDNIFNWIYELVNGQLQSQIDNLENIVEMINLKHPPIVKNINGELVLSNHIYDINKEDIIIDFKRINDLKKENNLNRKIEDYKCPLYSQLQYIFNKDIEEVKNNFQIQIKELKQEKVIQHLQQELDKEKSLKDQAITLTQSFIPMSAIREIKRSQSPSLCRQDDINCSLNTKTVSIGKLKPSKIQ